MTISETFTAKVKKVRNSRNPKYRVYRMVVPHEYAERLGLEDEDYVLVTMQKAEWYHLLDWREMEEAWLKLPDDIKVRLKHSGLPEALPVGQMPLSSFCSYLSLGITGRAFNHSGISVRGNATKNESKVTTSDYSNKGLEVSPFLSE
jgi:hypothetical protein